MIEPYEASDPDQESATEPAKRLGISKARLYQILDEEAITPKARRPREGRLSEQVAALSASTWDAEPPALTR